MIRRRVRDGDLHEVLPGVYRLSGAPSSWLQRLTAALLWAGPNSCASHRSAAALLGLDGFDEDIVELTTTRSLKTRPGVVVHRVGRLWDYDMMLKGPFMLTTPARTLLDLGAVATADGIELALEDALRRKLTTLSALRWELRTRGGQGKPGTVVLKKTSGLSKRWLFPQREPARDQSGSGSTDRGPSAVRAATRSRHTRRRAPPGLRVRCLSSCNRSR